MSYATFREDMSPLALAVLSLRGVLPLMGAWAFEVELDATAAETPARGARASLDIAGRVFAGYVADVAPWAGRARLVLEAGAAGMRATVPAQGYYSALVSTLVSAMVADAGEVLASELPPGVVLEHYERAEQSGAAALTALCRAQGLGWRFADDGRVRVAPETWLPANEVGVLEMEPDGAAASTELAPLTASLSPGMTWQSRRIERVVYRLPEGEALAARLVFERDAGGDMKGLFERAVRSALRELVYAKRWPCSVVSQDAAGRLELQPDDSIMAGTPAVPVLLGLPGARVEVPADSRVGLVHEGADPARPRALGFEQGTPATALRFDVTDEIQFNGGTASVHREGDIAEAGTMSALGGPLIYHCGDDTWQITGMAGMVPVVFAIVPSNGVAGRLHAIAGPGAPKVKA